MAFSFDKLCYDLRYQVYRHMIPHLEIQYPLTRSLSDTSESKSNCRHQIRYGMILANKKYSGEFLDFVYKQATFVFPIENLNTVDFRHWPVSFEVLSKLQLCRFIDSGEASGRWNPPKEIYLMWMSTLLRSLRRMELEVLVNPIVKETEAEGTVSVSARRMPYVLQSVVTEIPCKELALGDPLQASYVW